MTSTAPLDVWSRNAFFVLSCAPATPAPELERAAHKLLALLSLGSSNVSRFETPLGLGLRDPSMVREAIAAIRDPEKRVLHELWAHHFAGPGFDAAPLDAALRGLATLAASADVVSTPDVERIASALDEVLESRAFKAHATDRCLAVGLTSSPEPVIERFRFQAADLLASVLGRIDNAPAFERVSPLLWSALDRANESLFRELEARCADYGRRVERRISYSEPEERRAWGDVQRLAARLRLLHQGPTTRLFAVAYPCVSQFAVFQRNLKQRHGLAFEMYLWLLKMAGGHPAEREILARVVARNLAKQR